MDTSKALENLRLLRKLGVAPSHADRRALLAAATALGEAPLAQEVLMEVTVEEQREPGCRSLARATCARLLAAGPGLFVFAA